MSTRKQPTNFVQRLLKRVWRSFNVLFKTLLNGVLRGLRVSKRRSRQSQAGFVLPTVVMVLLVVALLTTAIVIRSFDRAKNASNYRVDQAVLNAATPALDRARAKIERLFSTEENRLTATPAPEGLNYDDTGTISEVLSQKEYIFGDETQLKVVDDIDESGAIDNKREQIKTAWKFPTDSDNNGKFDSFTLYGIYFRNPLSNENRARSPLEARARPQVTRIGSACETAGNGGGNDTQGWYETDGQLKKAFFTYVANVPITTLGSLDATKYETYTGNKSFSALEMQQDQGQISLDNNAVWYNDDLVISNVPTFRLNGRVHTNSNLMVANSSSQDIVFYQVSSVDSCYYTAENAKIIVGGHVVAGDITGDAQGNATDSTETLVKVHLFTSPVAATSLGNNSPPGPVFNVNAANKTTNLNPAQIATNSNAYETRLNALVNEAVRLFNVANPNGVTAANVEGFTRFPDEVKANFKAKFGPTTPASAGASILKQVLNTYFAERLRRVSYQEVAVNADPLGTPPWTTFTGTGIQPPVAWMLYDPSNPAILPVKTASGGAGIELEATIPPSLLGTGRDQQEKLIGDRILVGNSLPRKWWQPATGTYAKAKQKQEIPEQAGRYREGLVEQLDDLGDTSRGGYWERAAALSGSEFEQPSIKELAGGLRVVTGAGIYIDGLDPAGGGTGRRGVESFLPPPPTALELKQMADADPGSIKLPKDIRNATPEVLKTEVRVVWPDTMPMSEDQNGAVKRGDLQMRATVVYHSAITSGTNQTPIACIATLYDPTSAKTAQSFNGLPTDPDHQVPASTDDPTAPSKGLSINGINYPIPSDIVTKRASANTDPKLVRQANMIFPDGRWVNKPLRDAVLKLGTSQGLNALNIADIAAIDAANCALNIMKAPTAVSSSVVPDFAIKEEAFLDARQIKAIHKRNTIANFPATTKPSYDPARSEALVPLKDTAGNYVTRETTREYISNPDKLQIAELGELNWDRENLKKTVTNYPFYSLPIEQRQPLEIRVTQINLDLLRKKAVGTNNYLLPNSGIIYASRDDALPDISDFNPNTDGDKGSSATDFFLDPTRRPNGILLVNGANLLRKNEYRIEEKGLILATDLPVYIKSQKLAGNPGGFNLHLKPDATAINDANVREEFINLVDSDYKDFYNRQAGTNGSGFNPNFACRKGQSGCTEGDQWRAARILSDAVTLLSSNFRFGYRNEGDFDLNNNVGNLAVESRLKQGFWWNAFATNGEWVDPANGYPKDFDAVTGTQGSTYVTNGVTPIQRRVNFPEYKMEICRKLPVAACGPGDWKLEIPGAAAPYQGTGSGTTAPIEDTNPTTNPRYVAPADRRYPRRVAFQRNSAGELIVPDTCTAAAPANCKATPIGAAGPVPYDGTTTAVPPAANNALWFWTTGDNTNPSPVIGTPTLPTDVLTLPPNVSYNNTNKLYYAPYEPEEVSERQLLLPGLPEFPNILKTATPAVKSLNSSSATNLRSAPSDYAVLNFTDIPSPACNFSKDYKPGGTLPACATDTETTTNLATNQVAIRSAWGQFLTYNRTTNDDEVYLDKNDTINPLPFNPPGGLRNLDYVPANKDTITLKAYAKVNIYSLPKPVNNTEILSGLDIIFDSNNRIDDPIFVIRPFDPAQNLANDTPLIFLNSVKVITKGVDPNNIFWVPTKYLQFIVHNDANDHELAGNFIGGGLPDSESLFAFVTNQRNLNGSFTTPYTSAAPNILKGARFLGFDPTSVIPTGAMTAMTTTAEPLLIPVLNLHSPEGTPADTVGGAFGGQTINQNYWVQRVLNGVTETYNAVFIMGDSPSRPLTGIADPRYSGESGGGLGNFPRFLEAWQSSGDDSAQSNANTKISGSFIQFKRSIFATAPFEAIDDPKQDNSLFFDTPATGIPDYMQPFAFVTANRPYVYKGGGQLRKAPYYRPPNRAWGYDIGLLKQSPDLFSRRFSTPSAGTPNEYYREVSRDDLWVKTLMCAAEQVPAAAVGAPPAYSQWAIADPKQRPSDCPSLNQYADPQP